MAKYKKKKQLGLKKSKPKIKLPASIVPQLNDKMTLIIFGSVLLLLLLVRFNLLNIPLERDEGGFAYIGEMALKGKLLYTELHDIKLPGLYYTYGIITKLFGYSPTGIHTGLLLFNFCMTGFLFFFIKKLYDNLTAVVAVATFALMSVGPNVLGFATHATQLLILPGFLGIWLLIKALDNDKRFWILFSGLLLGYAFTIKQQAVYFMLLAGIYLLFDRWHKKPTNWKKGFAEMGILIAGSVLPFLIVVGYMSLAGRFEDFWFWTFEYPREEGLGKTLDQSLNLFLSSWDKVSKGQGWLWVLALLGFGTVFFSGLNKKQKFFAISLPIFMFGGVITGFHFYNHYFVMILPAIALLNGLFVSNINALLKARNLALLGVFPIIIFFFAWSQIIQNRPNYFFNPDHEEIIKQAYYGSPFIAAKDIGEYIKNNSNPDDKIAVFGSEPEIMVYADRESVTGHIFIYSLTDGRDYNERLIKDMMNNIRQEKPKFLVEVYFRTSWLNKDKDQKLFNAMNKELNQNYIKVGLVDSSNPANPIYKFGEEMSNFKEGNERIMWVLKRR
jgi:4-amino-4-deoxy-L-arabinose transferase-like glycosyltransferase